MSGEKKFDVWWWLGAATGLLVVIPIGLYIRAYGEVKGWW